MDVRISNAVSAIREMTSATDKSASGLRTDISGMQQYWEGDAGRNFSEGCRTIERTIRELRGELNSLSSRMRALDSSIQRAEAERRRREQEQLRLQQASSVYYRF